MTSTTKIDDTPSYNMQNPIKLLYSRCVNVVIHCVLKCYNIRGCIISKVSVNLVLLQMYNIHILVHFYSSENKYRYLYVFSYLLATMCESMKIDLISCYIRSCSLTSSCKRKKNFHEKSSPG